MFVPEHVSVLVEAADLCQQGVLDPAGVRQDGRQRGLRALVPHDVVDGLDHAPEITKCDSEENSRRFMSLVSASLQPQI